MVYYNCFINNISHFPALGKTRPVSVRHYHQVRRLGHELSLLAADEMVVVGLDRQLVRHIDRIPGIDDYIYFFFSVTRLRDPGQSDSRAESVHIRIFVTHDEYAPRLVYEVEHGDSYDTRFALIAFTHCLQLAAVVFQRSILPYYSLVAAASQRQIQRRLGKFVCLVEALS